MKHIFGLVGGILVLIIIGVVLAQIIMPSKTSDSLEVVTEIGDQKQDPVEIFDLDPVACTMDVKQCEDGSYVGRIAPDCTFSSCPKQFPVVTSQISCPSVNKGEYECMDIYEPVCGLVEVQCIKGPCEPIPKTFGNSCNACNQNNVIFYTEGACGGGNSAY